MSISFSDNKKEYIGWILIGIIVLLILVTIYLGYFFRGEEKIKLAFKNGNTLSFLVAGYNKDHIIKGVAVVFYQTKTNRVSLVSILPKTYLFIDDKHGYITLDEALVKKINYEQISSSISSLIGQNINYYFFISNENFIKLVDIFGGVEIDSEEYKYPNLNVNIPAGKKLLDGEKSIEFLSFLKNDEENYEYKQLKRIQEYIKGSLYLKNDFQSTFTDYIVGNYIYKSINSNITLNELIIIFNELKSKYKNNYKNFATGFEPIILYCDLNKINDKDYVFMPKKSGEWIKSLVSQSIKNMEKTNAFSNNLALEILNGTDVIGLGAKAKNYLISYGYDVENVTNADKTDYGKTTLVVYHNEQKARKMAELINCKNIIINDIMDDKKIDATLILGYDYDGRIVR